MSTNTYRILLFLYPADFRRHFAAEMLSVFEQRALERRGARLLLIEYFSILKGAYIMWFARILPAHRSRLPQETTPHCEPSNLAEARKQRDTAISNMVTSIAKHDFDNARRYSREESRLKDLIEGFAKEERRMVSRSTV
jgi:hypothetical protein